MSTSLAFLRLPPLPDIPEPLRQGLVVHVRVAFTGSAEEGARLVAPIRGLGDRVLDTVAEMPYAAVPSIHMDPPEPIPNYSGAGLFDELSDAALDSLLAAAGPDSGCRVLMVELRRLGGAAGRPPAVPNAAGNRQAGFTLFNAAPLMPGIEAAMKDSCDNVVAAMAPHGNGKSMLNFLTDHDGTVDRVRTAFEPEAYARLAALKKTYDPAQPFPALPQHPTRGMRGRQDDGRDPRPLPRQRCCEGCLSRREGGTAGGLSGQDGRHESLAPAAPSGLACRGS